MGDAQNTGVCMCKTLTFCSNTCVFIRKNPFVLGLFLFAFFIYKYFPSVFSILIYSSPVLACTLVLIKFVFCLPHPKEQNPKKNESVSVQDDDVKRNENSSLHKPTSKRRIVNEKSRQWDNDNLISRSVPSAEKLNESLEGKGGSGLDGVDSSTLSGFVAEQVQRPGEKPDSELGRGFSDCRIDGGGSELEAESTEEAEDEDEEGHEYGHKAVEWTEDDQKNLMDLGTSETERNKRLESLIAKRRARKLMKMQVEKDLIDLNNIEQVTQIAPILIARNNLLHPDNSDKDSPIPGSAPSILVPGRNPFDLPYDPQEEKPNLLGDSFQQEFTIPHQKELFFCRHESFSLGSFHMGDSKQEPYGSKRFPDFTATRPWALEGSGFPRFKWSPYGENRERPSQHDASMSHINSDEQGGQLPELAEDSEGTFHEKERGADLMIRTEEKEEASTSDMESELSERNDIPMKIELVEGKSDESSSSSLSEAKEHNDQANETSPSSDPSPDYGDMNEEVTAGSRETWVASSHLSAVEEIEAMSTEVNEISEEDIIQVGFSGVNQDSENSMFLALHPAQGASGAIEDSSRDASSIYNVSDPALPASDGMEDLKSIQSIDAEPLDEETNPTTLKSIEDEREKVAVEGNDNSTSMEDIVQEPDNLTAQEGNVEEAETIEGKKYLELIQDSERDQGNVEAGSSGGDQGHVEAGSFGGNQSSDALTSTMEPERVFNQGSDDLIASTVQPELAAEQISNHSSLSSSPKSVLPDKVPVDEVSSWSFNPEVHVTVQQSNMEDNALHELLPPNFNLTMPTNAQHLMEDATAYSSNNSDYKGQQEHSNTSEITSEANISHNIIENAAHDKEGEEKKSAEDNEDESQSTPSTSLDAAAKSSKPDELTVSRSIEDDEDRLERTSAYEASIGPSNDSYPDEENANSDVPASMANDSHPAEENANSDIPASMANDSHPAQENANSDVPASMANDSHPAEENANPDIPASMANEQEPSSLPMKSTEEASIVHNWNGLEVSGNASIASKEEDNDPVERPKADGTSSSRSITGIEAEPNKETEDEATGGASKSMGDNKESISAPDTEDFKTSTEHGATIRLEKPENTIDNSESARDGEGDYENLTRYETTIYPPEQGNLGSNLNIPTSGPVGEELPEPPREESTEEANNIVRENEAEADQTTIKRTVVVGDGEGDSQSSITQFAVVGSSEATEATNSVTIQDTEGKSGQLIHDTYVEDNATLDTIGDVKENKGETADLSQDEIGTNK